VRSTDRRVPRRRVSTGRPALDRSLAPLGNRSRSRFKRNRSLRRRDRVAPSVGRTCRDGLARPKRPNTAVNGDRGKGTREPDSGSVPVVRWDGHWSSRPVVRTSHTGPVDRTAPPASVYLDSTDLYRVSADVRRRPNSSSGYGSIGGVSPIWSVYPRRDAVLVDALGPADATLATSTASGSSLGASGSSLL
jgi:hypothetical protein